MWQCFPFRSVPPGMGDTYRFDRISIREPSATERYRRNRRLPATRRHIVFQSENEVSPRPPAGRRGNVLPQGE
ncbi:hypothetical protein BHM03_00005512, partial [Ensete ventricosum]